MTCYGIDLNRNWPLDFGQRGGQAVSDVMCGETFSGRSYFQAEEVRRARAPCFDAFHAPAQSHTCQSLLMSHTNGRISLSCPAPSVGLVSCNVYEMSIYPRSHLAS
mmetsp:Transcript_20404/g.52241  ORF Transcript_20404/g.52241 Transcript_20404/m.52241 type:complete len:106 (+) Transcript_20404:73-390(+)